MELSGRRGLAVLHPPHAGGEVAHSPFGPSTDALESRHKKRLSRKQVRPIGLLQGERLKKELFLAITSNYLLVKTIRFLFSLSCHKSERYLTICLIKV